MLTCPLGCVPACLATAANAHGTQPVGALLDRAAQDGWGPSASRWTAPTGANAWPEPPRTTIQDYDMDVPVTAREPDQKGFKPLPLRWRIEAAFGTRANRHRLLRA